MKKNLFALFGITLLFSNVFAQLENYPAQNKTPTYQETMKFFSDISKKNAAFKWISGDKTDVGKPLNLFVISKNKNFDPAKIKSEKKAIVFINNAIHPGEPDGVDACIQIVKEFAADPKKIPDSVVICIVPIYNVDGALQRNSVMRMNQNGPQEFGFRGNAQNLDLNRDFMKCNAGNTKALAKFFHEWKPDVFIDTHVSNGADYTYTMTLITTQRSKLPLTLSNFVTASFTTAIYDDMKAKGMEMCPYVESIKETPDSGLVEFHDSPRYSTGWASLFNCIGFVTESHMLKPYPQRVKATIEILKTIIGQTQIYRNAIISVRKNCDKQLETQREFLFNWKLNEKESNTLEFKGYTAGFKKSSISGMQRLYYDREKPWTKLVPYYCFYRATETVKKPARYIVPQAYKKVIELLQLNKIKMTQLKKDTSLECEMYYITDFKTGKNPYEGHYVHSEIKTRTEKQSIRYFAGDYVIEMNQPGNRYIVEALEPRSEDSFFAWGFFDGILNQKEWFSDYVFEEVAEKILAENPEVKTQLEDAKLKDKDLAGNHWNQLNFIFQHSKYKEKSHNRYPVGRIF